ncbi:MAG TPA: hypothetical protein VF041_16300 [Gemmatimonadaceae bacterium]
MITRKGARGRTAAGALLAALLSFVGVGAARAQQAPRASVDARWQAWLGCWEPVGRSAPVPDGTARARLVCVVPASGTSAVEIASVDSGRVVTRERIVASGAREPVSEGGCTGWRSARWSPDGQRLYLKGESECTGGVRRATDGVFAIAPGGEWLDIRGITAGTNTGVSVLRYREAPIPAELADRVAEPSLAARTARTSASAPPTTADVVDASKALDARTVEAWLVARGDRFHVDARQLEQLADAGVPGSVTDVMVALSYPQKFAIAPSRDVALRAEGGAASAYEGTGGATQSVVLDPYGYGYYSPYDLMMYPWLGYSPYGYGYGYGGFGYGWFPGGGPVVIIREPGNATPVEHGRVVNGRGYSRGTQAEGDERRGASESPRRTSGSSAHGASSGASSGRTSTGRTAKPRP